MSRRAIVPEADLRRWAKIARTEGVAIRGDVAPDGSVSISINPPEVPSSDYDIDAQISKYLGK